MRLNEIDGLRRIKFVTNYPRHMTDDLLQAVRDLRKVSPYLHVPAQSGSNEQLKRMKRGYTVEHYREMIERIRDIVPDAAISSDFIVGFCGKTEDDFQQSVELVRWSRFKNSFIFKYSERPGTKAADLMPDDVPDEVKRRRNNELLAVQNAISLENNLPLAGQDIEVLVEGPSKSAQKRAGANSGPRTSQPRMPRCSLSDVPRAITSWSSTAYGRSLGKSCPCGSRRSMRSRCMGGFEAWTMIDLFKEVLTTFFIDFLEVFCPELAVYVERESIEFLDKEVFTDVTHGERHEADLVAKAKFRGKPLGFLIHVEAQSQPQKVFGQRMFTYFARFHEKYDLPVYPIALFSYQMPMAPEPDGYRVDFPDLAVLKFRFRVVQLNQLEWRDFEDKMNPVIAAFMANMHRGPEEAASVKLACLRMLARLSLDPARRQLISGFIDSYLRLTMDETKQFGAELRARPPREGECDGDCDKLDGRGACARAARRPRGCMARSSSHRADGAPANASKASRRS